MLALIGGVPCFMLGKRLGQRNTHRRDTDARHI